MCVFSLGYQNKKLVYSKFRSKKLGVAPRNLCSLSCSLYIVIESEAPFYPNLIHLGKNI